MVGGLICVFCVCMVVGELFGCELLIDIDLDQVVVIGVVIQVDVLVGNKCGEELLLLDVILLLFGLEIMGGLMEKVILCNIIILVVCVQEFIIYKDGQMVMMIYVLQGECELVKDCCLLVCFELCGILLMVVGVVKIWVIFQVDVDGLFGVFVCELSFGVEVSIQVKLFYGLIDGEIVWMFKDFFDYVGDDKVVCVLCEQQVEVQWLLEVVQLVLDVDGEWFLDEEECLVIVVQMDILCELVGGSDIVVIENQIKCLFQVIDVFVVWWMDVIVKVVFFGCWFNEIEE